MKNQNEEFKHELTNTNISNNNLNLNEHKNSETENSNSVVNNINGLKNKSTLPTTLKNPRKKQRRSKYFIKNENQIIKFFKSEKEYFTALAEKLIQHLKSGYSPDSFPYEDASLIEKYFYLKEEGVENRPGSVIFRIKQAERTGRRKWEKIALDQIEKDSNFFPASLWIFCMKNLFNWANSPEKLSQPNITDQPRTIRLDGNGWDENDE